MTTNFNLPDPRDLDFEDIAPVLAQLAGLQTALAARLISERPKQGSKEEEEYDPMLTTVQAAELLNVSKLWLYHRSKTLPPSIVVRLSSNALRFRKRALLAWATRRRN